MLVVHKFGEAWGAPDISPFVVKLETWLRLAGIAYEATHGDPRKAPKRKLPYVVDDGVALADTRFIAEHLTKKHGVKLDDRLSPAQRAIATAFRSMIEEHLYFIVIYERWQLDENWARYEPTMKSIIARLGVPGFLQGMIAKKARKDTVAKAYAQGTGRHTKEEVARIGDEILGALSTQIGDGPYFFGGEPASVDATAYAFLAGILDAPFEGAVKDAAARRANLRAYVDRVKAKYWGDPSAHASR